MKRSCTKLPINEYIIELGIPNTKNISIYIDFEDSKNCKEIITFINANKDKFRRILYVILLGLHNNDLYGKEKVGSGTENITAMKFKGKLNANKRIYCKEFFINSKKIVMITMISKKVQKLQEDKKIINRLKIIGGYEYEFK